jgi:hypothetical protein
MSRLIVVYHISYIQLLISRYSSTIRRNLSAEFIRAVDVSCTLVDFAVVVAVVVVNEGYFFSKSWCLIEPKRTNTGVSDFFVVAVDVGTFRSIAKRGLVAIIGSVAKARKGPFDRVSFVDTPSNDDRGL